MLKNLLGVAVLGSLIIGGCAEAGPDVASADRANEAIKNQPNEEWFKQLKSAPLSMDQKITAINGREMSDDEKKKFIEQLKSGGSEGPAGAGGR